ncbi:MAG: hypothetical protein WCP65_02855 [Bacteroidota bacterium]
MIDPHVSRDFNNMSADKVFKLAGLNRIGIRENNELFSYAKIPKPPFTDEQYGLLIDTAKNKYLIYDQGGRAQKPDADTTFSALLGGMEEFAVYVDLIAKGNEGTIIKSGLNVANAAGEHHKQTFPGTPYVSAARADATGEIDTECEVFGRGAVYNCVVSEGAPLDAGVTISGAGQLFIPVGITHRIILVVDVHRKKKITGLTPGVYYWFYYYVANIIGVSQFSVGAKVMCG